MLVTEHKYGVLCSAEGGQVLKHFCEDRQYEKEEERLGRNYKLKDDSSTCM